MRPKLLKSFLTVVLFWFIATTIYWSMANPALNWAALADLKKLLPFLPIDIPKNNGAVGALVVQLAVLKYWTLPVLALSALSCLVGWAVVWVFSLRQAKDRTGREKGHGAYRGMRVTLGSLPSPTSLPRDVLDLASGDSAALARLTEKEKRLLGDILGTASAHPGAFSGEGNGASLLEHMLNVASKALERQRNPGLSAIVAAGHELGKITAWAKNEENQWVLLKNQDREASKHLTALDSWWDMDKESRLALLLAVKYHSNVRQMPDVDGEHRIYRLARDLLDNASEAQASAVVEEKQKTLEKHELPDVLFEAFLRALPTLSFQSFGMPKNVPAIAWKVGSRVYMLEIKLRETVMGHLSQEVRGALIPSSKDKSKVAPFTLELLKALQAKGWLVQEVGKMRLDTKEALWIIQAGKLEFKGVIIIDVPLEHQDMLPPADSAYAVAVSGPLYSQPGAVVVSRNEVMGDMLRPKAVPAVPAAPAVPAVPAVPSVPAAPAEPIPPASPV